MRQSMTITVLTVGLFMVLATGALAQDDLNCDDFEFQEDAQAELDQDPSDPHGLDGDDDGIPCEDLPSRGSDTSDDGADDASGGEDADEGQMPAGGVDAGAGGAAATDMVTIPAVFAAAGALLLGGVAAAVLRRRA